MSGELIQVSIIGPSSHHLFRSWVRNDRDEMDLRFSMKKSMSLHRYINNRLVPFSSPADFDSVLPLSPSLAPAKGETERIQAIYMSFFLAAAHPSGGMETRFPV